MEALQELEARLLINVGSVAEYQRIGEIGIRREHLRYYAALYDYMGDTVKDFGHLPRPSDIVATFNIPRQMRRREEFAWLLEEFARVVLTRDIQDTTAAVVDRYSKDPRAMLGALVSELSDLQMLDRRYLSVTDQSAVSRFRRYEAAAGALAKGEFAFSGLPTGLSCFDAKARLGWMPGELVGIVGRLYMGKSWILVTFGVVAWQVGARVLFISPEMPLDEAEARFDVLAAARLGGKLSVSDMYRGFQPDEAAWDLAKQLSQRQQWITVSSAEGKPFNVADIGKLIQQHRPTLVLVDGLSLLVSDSGRQVWEQVFRLAYTLKSLAVATNVPILVTHQANREAYRTGQPPQLHQVAGGDSFAQACDRILALSNPVGGTDNRLRITVQKFRRGRPHVRGVLMHFEPESGEIYEIGDYQPPGADGSDGESPSGETGGGGGDPLPVA